jgi:hypothetical protein
MKKYILSGCIALISLGCAENTLVEIEGKIFLKGSTPHTYVVIEDQKHHKNYKIENANHFNLLKKQNQSIKIKAKFLKKAIAPGFPAVIKIVEIN